MVMHNSTLLVLNGGDTGNYIEKFSLGGNYTGQYPGWYNWPVDLVAGPAGQLLVSAIGAMDDTHHMG